MDDLKHIDLKKYNETLDSYNKYLLMKRDLVNDLMEKGNIPFSKASEIIELRLAVDVIYKRVSF